MNRIKHVFFSLALGCTFACGGCATAKVDPVEVLNALGKFYAHCDRTVNYSASAGPINPSTGATISGSVHCPGEPYGGMLVGAEIKP